MPDKHPFERLPESWQQHPVVLRAWLVDLSSRRPAGDRQKIDPVLIRGLGLMLMAMTALGIITPEQFLKFLIVLLRAGSGA